MSHSYSKLFVHLVIITKRRTDIIKPDLAGMLYDHITDRFIKNQSDVLAINGTANHVHVLFQLSPTISLSDLVKLVKGETSHWINSKSFLRQKFSWQVGYGAFSVSESSTRRVVKYIKRQKEHHRKINFRDEFELLLKHHRINISH
ncbi:MAG: IS200/IS605 family transposase [Bacteroidales bacterium]|nr:IS200/IS605 family transposase [Bacteroidales bacterium]